MADAAVTPIRGGVVKMTVPRVGDIWARPPQPRSAAALGMSVWLKAPPAEQHRNLVQFITDHLADGEYERLLAMLIDSDDEDPMPEDTITRVARTIACHGTARPYAAVTTLSLYTGHSWRTVRYKLLLAGIPDPMQLPSLHAVLDVTEQIVVESLFRSAEEREGPPSKGEMKVQSFYDTIYRPDPVDVDASDEPVEEDFVPAGFEDPDEMEASFDSFAAFGR